MKRIYVIVLAAAFSASIFSCEEKPATDRVNEPGDSIKKTIENESEKTTKHGSDAH
jgi:hypothetical protein